MLVETKFLPPRVPEGALSRAALVQALQERIDAHSLTLVSAGAGFGKTSLLAGWYASLPVPETVAWVTIDGRDNDPVLFWTDVAESLRRTYRDRLESASEPLPSSVSEITATIANELVALRALRVLVLDDFQDVSNPDCLAPLDDLLADLPPRMRVVISARVDPPLSLARLRAKGKLGEVRAADLAFTSTEARELVATTPTVRLGPASADHLRRRTEGWPAGMYLALLAAGGEPDPRTFVEHFTGRNRMIADYLLSEVLAGLDEETRSFLVRTSILDELSAPLCDAALEITDSAERLIELERSNLFVAALDDRRERFHCHQLFRDLLELEFGRLDDDVRSAVHLGASAWYAEAGRPADAIEHALAAGEWDRAADLIHRFSVDMVRAGHVSSVIRWTSALPEDAIVARPLLPAFAAARACTLGSPPEEVNRWLDLVDRSRRRFPKRWTPEAEAVATFPRAASLGTNVAAAVEAGRRLVEVGSRSSLHGGTIDLGTLAWALFLAGDVGEAKEAAEQALASEHVDVWAGGTVQADAVLALVAAEEDDVERALRHAAEAAEEAMVPREDRRGAAPMAVRARLAHAVAFALAGNLERAEREARAALDASPQRRDASRVFALIVLASIYRKRRRFARARDTLKEGERVLRGFVDAGRLPELLADERRHLASAESRARGAEQLTDGEMAVMRLLVTDLTLGEIASELFLSRNTIKTHCRRIYRKLKVGSRADAVARADDLGLLATSPASSLSNHENGQNLGAKQAETAQVLSQNHPG